MWRRALRYVVQGRRRAALTAVGAAATALVVAGCGSQVGAGDHGQPPKLHIGTGSGGVGAMAGEAVPALAPSPGRLGLFGGYVLVGQLPTSPTHAPVWRWPTGPDGAASRAQVTQLGALLGLTGTPQRHAHGWLLASSGGESSGGELRVRDGESLAWSYVRGQTDCPPYQVDIDNAGDGGVGCAEASAVAPAGRPGASTPSAVAPAPSDAPARALLSSLRISGAEHSQTDLGSAVLTVDPIVGSLPTQGIATSVIVDRHGVRAATGHLGVPEAGADYPLRSAQDSFADLGAGPRPMIAQYCGPMPAPAAPPSAAGAPSALPKPQPCPSPAPTRVTGATLGLLATWDGGSAGPNVLVPAWFFTVEGSSYPLPAVAVDPAFIAAPTPDAGVGSGAGSASVGSSGSGVVPAPTAISVPPAAPASPVPASPSN